jgi:preprotein translocase subunit SecB
MADEGNIITDLNSDPVANGLDDSPAAGVISQYVKDLSVENPNAPQSYQWAEAPQIDVQFNIGAQLIEGDVHEVELKIVASAKTSAGTAYVVDLVYAGLIGIRNIDEGTAHAFMFAEAPRILFPFARRIVADSVRDAGFTPLMLDPIDFNGLYMQQLAAAAEQQGEGEGEGEGAPAGQA